MLLFRSRDITSDKLDENDYRYMYHVISINIVYNSLKEQVHQMLIKKRERVDQKAMNKKAKLVRQQSMVGDTR